MSLEVKSILYFSYMIKKKKFLKVKFHKKMMTSQIF
jgi:hypothetical protein